MSTIMSMPETPALTPATITSDSPTTQAESSTSRRRSARHIPPPLTPEVADTEPEDAKVEPGEEEEDDEVFVVGAIVAKSMFKAVGPWGNEYQYLVRWAGYGPKDDTWEWCSNVAQNASEMLRQFDKEGHRFTVTDSDDCDGRKGQYLFEMCARRSDLMWSPKAEKRWMTPAVFATKKRVPMECVKKAIKEWEELAVLRDRDNKRKYSPNGENEDEEDFLGKTAKRVYLPGERKRYSKRVLLQILDERQYRKNLGPWQTRYRVRHYLKDRKRGYQEKDEWYTNRYLILLFGPEIMRDKLHEYMPEPKKERVKVETLEDGTIVRHDVVSDYEKDRLRRIKEHEDLIKQLGL